jgi:hypothetical protein
MATKVTRARRKAESARADGREREHGGRPGARSQASGSGSVNQALERAVSDAQDIGSGLGAAGATVAKGTVRLAYDVGAIMGLAGTSVVSGTVAVARDIIRRAESWFGSSSAATAESGGRKPLKRARNGSRRAPAETPQPAATAESA